ncbi:mechanosensitive ion channel family protein [Kribbella sp. NPDC002412]
MSALAIDFTQPFEDAFGKLLGFVPNLLGGLVILVIGYFVAKVLGKLVGKLLGKVGFDQWMERAGVSGVLQRSGTGLTASAMLGKVVFWFVFLISFTMFASALGVPEISAFMSDMLGYIPRIFAAIVIICLAALFANFLAAIIRGATGNETLAKVGKYAVLVYAAFAALTQLGIAVQLTGNTLLIVLAGAALAMGLAFGLGGRELAGRALSNLFDRSQLKPQPDDTMSNGTMSNGAYDQGGYQQGGYDQGNYPPPQEQHPAHHGAPQAGWSNGTTPDGNWQGNQR